MGSESDMLLGRSSGWGRTEGEELMVAAAVAAVRAAICASVPFVSCGSSTLAIGPAAVVVLRSSAGTLVTIGDIPAFLLMIALRRLLDEERLSGSRNTSSDCPAAARCGSDWDGDRMEARGEASRRLLRRPSGELVRPEKEAVAARLRGEEEEWGTGDEDSEIEPLESRRSGGGLKG